MSVTSPKGQEMMGYIPPYYATSIVMQAAMQADGMEFDSLKAALNDVLNQFFVDTATWGLSIWESTLGITTMAGKPDDQRRSVIKSKLRGIGTVTITMIQNVAEAYVDGSASVANHPETFSFIVTFVDPLGIPPNLADLQAVIEQIKPAHLAVNYAFTYTTWGNVEALTWAGVKTSTWGALKTRAI
jgi:uncharacterized protein YmfQ (DUF2313 family)